MLPVLYTIYRLHHIHVMLPVLYTMYRSHHIHVMLPVLFEEQMIKENRKEKREERKIKIHICTCRSDLEIRLIV